MEFAVYLFYRAGVAMLTGLSLDFVFGLGRLLGGLCYWLLPPYRKLVVANLTIAFANEKSVPEIRRLAREHFATLGANFLSSVKLSSMSEEEVRARVRWENLEFLEDALREGMGVIGAIGHLGNWEIFAQMPSFLPQQRFGTIYQKLSNPHLEAEIKKTRARFGVTPFDRKEGFNEPIKFVREGGGLAVLVDQHAGDGGVWTPLFGRLASTSPLTAMLALRTGAPIVPVAVYTDGWARWRLVASERLAVEADDVNTLTAQINQTLERQIRVSPRDWFWVHARWKTPHPKFLLAGYKRGVTLPAGFTEAQLQPFKILIRASNWLGDAVMSAPAVRAIRRGRPDAQVTVLTRAKLVDFWKTVPEVDEVLAIEPGDGLWRVARKIRVGNFAVAVVFPNSVRTPLEVFLGGVPRRVGFRGQWRGALLNQFADAKKSKDGKARPPRHQVFHYLQIAESIGAAVEDENLTEPALPRVDTSLRIGLCAGAEYGAAKRWLPERFAEVVQSMNAAQPCEWVLFGVEKDRAIGAQILPALGERGRDLIGKTTLAELIAELRQCRVLLTNDTGTMHLAAHLGVPVVAIFGSTEPALTGPLGARHRVLRHHVACSPCFLRECPLDFRCMKSVPVAEVADAVRAAL